MPPPNSNRLRPFQPVTFGRYTLLMPLSMGGMGEVFLARLQGALGFEKPCVIKKILPHLLQDKLLVARFRHEAQTLVKLTHGSIAQVLDVGQHENEPYLALEFIDGKDLRRIAGRARERGQPLPLSFVLYVMSRVLDALAYAHHKRDDDDREMGLVHRDVSPPNILVSYEGEVKVIDFGLAKSTLSASKTNPSVVLGKVQYMSPEQARHQSVDCRSDLYAVGMCLYELIRGRNPYEDLGQQALLEAVQHPKIAPLETLAPSCPLLVAQMVNKALSVDPKGRFQSAEEFRSQVVRCLMEVDSTAGPQSLGQVMRQMFATEFQAERKLFSHINELMRGPHPSPPLETSHSGHDVPDRERTLPFPVPSAPQVTSLSFEPTPRMSPTVLYSMHQGDRETTPGVTVEQLQRRALGDSAPDATQETMMPVEDLPSVVVSDLTLITESPLHDETEIERHQPEAEPMPSTTMEDGPTQVTKPKVQVVAPLPKALAGVSAALEDLETRRKNLGIGPKTLWAFLSVLVLSAVAYLSWDFLMQRGDDERRASRSRVLIHSEFEDQKRKAVQNGALTPEPEDLNNDDGASLDEVPVLPAQKPKGVALEALRERLKVLKAQVATLQRQPKVDGAWLQATLLKVKSLEDTSGHALDETSAREMINQVSKIEQEVKSALPSR